MGIFVVICGTQLLMYLFVHSGFPFLIPRICSTSPSLPTELLYKQLLFLERKILHQYANDD